MKYVRNAVLMTMGATLVACSEGTVSPSSKAVDNDQTYVHGGGISEALSPTDKYTFQMTIDPKKNTTWDLGANNSLTFPRGSLCDPTSTYGVTQWDRACVAAKSSVTLNVTVWVDLGGHPRVDFNPSVRFVPSADPRDWVILTFRDLSASLDPWFNINYCPTATSACYNEALLDPSLATLRDPLTGRITRRLKHFSGYNVAAGLEVSDYNLALSGAPSVASASRYASRSVSMMDLKFDNLAALRSAYPDATEQDATTMLEYIRGTRKFSGYILASGDQQ